MMIKGYRYNNLYLVDFTSEDANLKTCLFTKTTLGWLWHRRLAHVGMSSLKKLMKNDLVSVDAGPIGYPAREREDLVQLGFFLYNLSSSTI